MKRIEAAYLLAVATLLLVVFTISLQRCSEMKSLWQDSKATASLGKPRNVDVEQLRLLISQGKLADKEAKFYTASSGLEELPPDLPRK